MSVHWGSGWLARCVARVLRFPAPGDAVAVQLSIDARDGVLHWTRRMGTALLVTEQWIMNGLVFEKLGPVLCGFRVEADAQSLWYTQEYAGLRFGPYSLRLPRWLWPRVTARVTQAGSQAHSQVDILAPWIGLVLRYEGLVMHVHAVEDAP